VTTDGSRRWIVPFVLAPVLGLLSLILPVIGSPRRVPAPLFPLVATGVKHMSLATLGLLFSSGVVLGGAFGGRTPWAASFVVFAAMPFIILAEVIVDPTSHNLFPFELLMYGALSLMTLAGSGIGMLVRRRLLREPR